MPAPDAMAALAATSRAVVITDARQFDNPIIYVNDAFSKLCGYPKAEIIGLNCRFLQGADTDRQVCAEIRSALHAGVGIRREILNYRKDGTSYWNDLTIDPIRDATGRLTGYISSQSDAGLSRLAQDAKAEAEARLSNIAEHIPGYIYRRVMRADATVEFLYSSPSLNKMLGVGEAITWQSFFTHVHPDDRALLIDAMRRSAEELSSFREEFRLVSADGTIHWLRSDAPPRRMPNGEIVWDGLALEISAEKSWETQIARLALRDPLTGLLTREACRQALAIEIQTGCQEAGRCGLVYVDIVGFQDLNGRLGQPAGDDVLRHVAQRLGIIAESIAGVAARLGGDEFALMVPACHGTDALMTLASTVAKTLAHPMQINGQPLAVRTCIGVTLSQDVPASDTPKRDMPSELMTQAELALHWSKQAGCSGPVIYSMAEDDRFQNQAILARSLGSAIEQDELELHFQPLVDIASGRIVSAEALVRWHHPTLGMQRPDLFITLAERSGLIQPLGRWVLLRAMRQRRAWLNAGLLPPRIAINVSGGQLTEPGFVDFVAEALRTSQVAAGDFELELTEGEMIEASPQIVATLHALHALGFPITIDDFGAGHATFRYLRDFPIDKVKIDQLFVRKLAVGSNDALIIRAVIMLARSMGIGFVAEGIETEMQRDFLLQEGCVIGQGYLFSMPLVAEDFAWMLANDVKLPMGSSARGTDRAKGIGSESGMAGRPSA